MTDHQSCSPDSAQDFDAMCDLFTGHASVVLNWRHSYFGAAYSTRLKAAIAEMKYAIAEAEKHPEIRPDAAATAPATDLDLRLLVDIVWQHATESTAVPSSKTADTLIAKYRKIMPNHAQPTPEPVAWAPHHPKMGWDISATSLHKDDVDAFVEPQTTDWEARPLYASPPLPSAE
jgi:hypothetical protein